MADFTQPGAGLEFAQQLIGVRRAREDRERQDEDRKRTRREGSLNLAIQALNAGLSMKDLRAKGIEDGLTFGDFDLLSGIEKAAKQSKRDAELRRTQPDIANLQSAPLAQRSPETEEVINQRAIELRGRPELQQEAQALAENARLQAARGLPEQVAADTAPSELQKALSFARIPIDEQRPILLQAALAGVAGEGTIFERLRESLVASGKMSPEVAENMSLQYMSTLAAGSGMQLSIGPDGTINLVQGANTDLARMKEGQNLLDRDLEAQIALGLISDIRATISSRGPPGVGASESFRNTIKNNLSIFADIDRAMGTRLSAISAASMQDMSEALNEGRADPGAARLISDLLTGKMSPLEVDENTLAWSIAAARRRGDRVALENINAVKRSLNIRGWNSARKIDAGLSAYERELKLRVANYATQLERLQVNRILVPAATPNPSSDKKPAVIRMRFNEQTGQTEVLP